MEEAKKQILQNFYNEIVDELNAKLVSIQPLKEEVASIEAQLNAKKNELDQALASCEGLLRDKKNLGICLGFEEEASEEKECPEADEQPAVEQ